MAASKPLTPGQIGVDLWSGTTSISSTFPVSCDVVFDADLPNGPYGEMNMGVAGKIHVPPGSDYNVVAQSPARRLDQVARLDDEHAAQGRDGHGRLVVQGGLARDQHRVQGRTGQPRIRRGRRDAQRPARYHPERGTDRPGLLRYRLIRFPPSCPRRLLCRPLDRPCSFLRVSLLSLLQLVYLHLNKRLSLSLTLPRRFPRTRRRSAEEIFGVSLAAVIVVVVSAATSISASRLLRRARTGLPAGWELMSTPRERALSPAALRRARHRDSAAGWAIVASLSRWVPSPQPFFAVRVSCFSIRSAA